MQTAAAGGRIADLGKGTGAGGRSMDMLAAFALRITGRTGLGLGWARRGRRMTNAKMSSSGTSFWHFVIFSAHCESIL